MEPCQGWPLVATCKTTLSDKLIFYNATNWLIYLYSNWLICSLSYSFVVCVLIWCKLQILNLWINVLQMHSPTFPHVYTPAETLRDASAKLSQEIRFEFEFNIQYNPHLAIPLPALYVPRMTRGLWWLYKWINDRCWMAVFGQRWRFDARALNFRASHCSTSRSFNSNWQHKIQTRGEAWGNTVHSNTEYSRNSWQNSWGHLSWL